MIRTFIFFDLETTGLIGKNFMPKIIEMSLIAVSRTAICDTTDDLPRVLHKLVLPIHPNVNVSRLIQSLTGLSNENVQEVQCFNGEVYNLVIHFINRQKAPICFVAYNGNNFDYPIFLSEFKNIDKSFSEDILSIDMLRLVRDFFTPKQEQKEEPNVKEAIVCSQFNAEVSILLNDGYDEILSNALDSVMNTNFDNYNNKSDTSVQNETAISSNNELNTPQTSYCKKMQEINEKTPEGRIVKLQSSDENFQAKKGTSARRKLDFSRSTPSNFKLTSVCKHILGSTPENAHTAEEDCLSMIRCAVQLGNFFVEWADCKAVPLINHVKQ